MAIHYFNRLIGKYSRSCSKCFVRFFFKLKKRYKCFFLFFNVLSNKKRKKCTQIINKK